MIKIVISEQKLYHRRKTGVVYAYPISTAINGVGNTQGSLQTPLGKHRIYAKIGDGLPKNTAFVGREPLGIFCEEIRGFGQDWILSRILWLEGLELGVNRGGQVDSCQRYIYIHGTDEEHLIGTPASHGCIRMRNDDVLDLFEHVQEAERVLIKP